MLPWIDFNPKEIYCGNISACGIKLVLTIAASYKLNFKNRLLGNQIDTRNFRVKLGYGTIRMSYRRNKQTYGYEINAHDCFPIQ